MAKRAAKATAGEAGKVVEIVTRTTERRTGEDEELDVSGAADEGAEDDVLAALDDLGDSGARLEIRRTSPAEFAGYVGTYSRDGFTPDRLFEEWGGGKFTIRVRTGDGTFMGMRHVQIAGKSKNKELPQPAALAAPAVDNGMAQALAAIQAGNAAQAKSMEGQIALLTTLLTALINREPPKAPPAPDPLAMLEKAANILKPRGDGGDAMSAFIKGIDMGKSFADGGGEPGMASLFMEGIKTIKETAAVTAQRPPPRRIAAPGTVAAQPATPPPNKEEAAPVSDAMKQIAWIKQQTAFLVLQASRKKSPELYAELFLDNLPPFLPEAQVHEQMKQEGALDRLAMLNPAVRQHPEWFEEFRAAVVDLIEQPEEGVDQARGPDASIIEGEQSGGDGE